MKKLLQILTVVAVVFAMAAPTFAADKKGEKRDPKAPRTIVGQGVCPKCCLGEGGECRNAIQVTRKGKDGKEMKMVYAVEGDVDHQLFCKGNKKVAVTGTIKREGKGKDAKMTVVATKAVEAKGKGKGGKGKGKKKA